MNIQFYQSLLSDIKAAIKKAKVKTIFSVNAGMVVLYWEIGHLIFEKQQKEGWGSGVIPKLANDLKNEFPEIKGFSERNFKFMVQFHKEYVHLPIGKQPVSQLEDVQMQLITHIPWGHHILLMQKIKDIDSRFWYMQICVESGWSREVLATMITNQLHLRQGNLIHNFQQHLPKYQSDLVQQSLKDPYIFDFMTLSEPFTERKLEIELIKNIERFLLELGKGFAFVGRQYHLAVGEKDFYLDLLFYHLKMRCFVVIDLKKGEFKPEYAGKMNFYCSVVDDLLRHHSDQSTIGLILCENKNKIIAEYALRNIEKPIGISEFELTRCLPDNLKSSLPTIEDIENELQSTIS